MFSSWSLPILLFTPFLTLSETTNKSGSSVLFCSLYIAASKIFYIPIEIRVSFFLLCVWVYINNGKNVIKRPK